MLVQIEGKQGLVKESNNLVDALSEFNPKEVKSVVYTERYNLRSASKS